MPPKETEAGAHTAARRQTLPPARLGPAGPPSSWPVAPNPGLAPPAQTCWAPPPSPCCPDVLTRASSRLSVSCRGVSGQTAWSLPASLPHRPVVRGGGRGDKEQMQRRFTPSTRVAGSVGARPHRRGAEAVQQHTGRGHGPAGDRLAQDHGLGRSRGLARRPCAQGGVPGHWHQVRRRQRLWLVGEGRLP